MSVATEANRDQAALWTEGSGRTWVDMQAILDRVLAPFEKILIEQGIEDESRRVLDVGCGTGSTTLAAARRVGEAGSCVGVDISATLLNVAIKRAREAGLGNAQFVHADAQTHEFEPKQFDAVISRFGVMFFDDPTAAFANLRWAVRSHALLTCVTWRSPAENPFMTTAARAAAPLLPLPTPDPSAPGQFAFADSKQVQGILEASGWKEIDIRPFDVTIEVSKADLLAYVIKLGPVGLALRDADEPTRTKVTKAVHAAFTPFIQGDTAAFKAACWIVSARG